MYKVKVVKHNGNKGVRGMNFLDSKYFNVVGTFCEIDYSSIHKSQPLVLNIIKPFPDTWKTSDVKSYRRYKEDGIDNIEVETQNSIYTFETL